jgi:hypothetical protein
LIEVCWLYDGMKRILSARILEAVYTIWREHPSQHAMVFRTLEAFNHFV